MGSLGQKNKLRRLLTPCIAAALLCMAPVPVDAQQTVKIQPDQTCLDAGCHADLGTKNIIHKPASKATTCKFCHKAPDSTIHEFELAAKKSELCSKCHKMVNDEISQHMPAKRGMCTSCHDPHQSDNRNLLKKRPPGELCAGCHRKIGDEGDVKHGPVEGKMCTACHNPHASNNKKLLKEEIPGLCLGCHRRSFRSEDGASLPPTARRSSRPEPAKEPHVHC